MSPSRLEKFSGIVGVTCFIDGVPHHACRLCGTAHRIPDLKPAQRFVGFARTTVEKKPKLYGMVPIEVQICIPRFEKFPEVCENCREELEQQERERRSKGSVTAQRRKKERTEYF